MKPLSRPALRYHGGKWKLAPWIIGHFPRHRIYVEAFGGGGSVLLRKPRAYGEVYNDLWGDVVNVFRMLRDRPADLQRLLELTPFSREEFVATSWDVAADIADPLERARRTIFRSFAGFGSAATNGEFSTGFRSNSNKSGTTPAADWANFPMHVSAFADRLRGVVIEQRPAVEVILQQDSPETLHYIDPPYVHETRNMDRGNAAYRHEMTDADHVALAETLQGGVSGMVVLSGYASDLYDKRLFANWERVENRGAHADGARDRTEVLWLNPAASAALKSGRLL